MRGVRLAADRRRIKQDLRALKHHRARAFGVPLIPADPHAHATDLRVPDFEPRVARAEVELLLVTWAIRNMALAINPQSRPVGVDHRQAVVVRMPRLLEERDWEHD